MFKGPGKIVRDNKSWSYPVFELTGVNCNYTTFRNKYPSIADQFCSIGKRSSNVKENALKTFSKSEWSLLSEELKSRHSLENCDGCLKKKIYKSVLAQFSIKSLCLRKKAAMADLFEEKKIFMTLHKKL